MSCDDVMGATSEGDFTRPNHWRLKLSQGQRRRESNNSGNEDSMEVDLMGQFWLNLRVSVLLSPILFNAN